MSSGGGVLKKGGKVEDVGKSPHWRLAVTNKQGKGKRLNRVMMLKTYWKHQELNLGTLLTNGVVGEMDRKGTAGNIAKGEVW